MAVTYDGINNHIVKVPGTCVVAYLGNFAAEPDGWVYSLYDASNEEYADEEFIASGSLDFPGLNVSAEQVARVAFLLEVDYGPQ